MGTGRNVGLASMPVCTHCCSSQEGEGADLDGLYSSLTSGFQRHTQQLAFKLQVSAHCCQEAQELTGSYTLFISALKKLGSHSPAPPKVPGIHQLKILHYVAESCFKYWRLLFIMLPPTSSVWEQRPFYLHLLSPLLHSMPSLLDAGHQFTPRPMIRSSYLEFSLYGCR